MGQTWARNTIRWYWLVDTLFWQLSIVQISGSFSDTQGQIVGTRESLNGRKNIYGTKKSKERREEPLGTMSYQTSSNGRRRSGFWLVPENLCFSGTISISEDVSGCTWAPKLARNCEIKHWCGPTLGRSVGVRSRDCPFLPWTLAFQWFVIL